MRTSTICVFLVFALLACAQSNDSGWAGNWAGDWSGASGGAGALKLKLAQVDGKWTAETSFSLGDQEVPVTVKSIKIDGDSLEIVDEFDLQGNKLSSTLTGKRTGKSIEGKYRTTAGDAEADSGVWKATLK
jgi:hypothetical protein